MKEEVEVLMHAGRAIPLVHKDVILLDCIQLKKKAELSISVNHSYVLLCFSKPQILRHYCNNYFCLSQGFTFPLGQCEIETPLHTKQFVVTWDVQLHFMWLCGYIWLFYSWIGAAKSLVLVIFSDVLICNTISSLLLDLLCQ